MSTAPAPPASSEQPGPTSAPGPEPDPLSFIRVRTRLPRRPLPLNAARQPITTERLVLRALTEDDFPALRVLRMQPEVMLWTSTGVADQDEEETWAKLRPFLGGREEGNYNFAITLRETGEFIGLGGCHSWRSSLGWPEVGYMIKKEVWGKGFGTEFLRGFLGAWDALEREAVEVDVDARTISEGEVRGEDGSVRERFIAVTADGNDRSQGVLKKAGFELFLTWLAKDLHKGSESDCMIELPTFRYFPKGDK